FVLKDNRYGYFALGVGLLVGMWSIWFKKDLAEVAPGKSAKLDDIVSDEMLALLPTHPELTVVGLWKALGGSWQRTFITNHLLLQADFVESMLETDTTKLHDVWTKAKELSQAQGSPVIEPGVIATAIILTSQA